MRIHTIFTIFQTKVLEIFLPKVDSKKLILLSRSSDIILFLIMCKKEERSQMLRKNILKYYIKNPNKFLLRLRSLIRDGFSNKYLVVVFEKL